MCLADFKMGLISAPFSKDFNPTGKKEIKLSLRILLRFLLPELIRFAINDEDLDA